MGSGADKGIEVQAGGSLRLHGIKGVAPGGVNWTTLSQPAGPAAYQGTGKGIGAPVAAGGERRLHLAANVARVSRVAGRRLDRGRDHQLQPFRIRVRADRRDPAEGSGSRAHPEASRCSTTTSAAPTRAPPSATPTRRRRRHQLRRRRTRRGRPHQPQDQAHRRHAGLRAGRRRGDQSLHWGGEIRICQRLRPGRHPGRRAGEVRQGPARQLSDPLPHGRRRQQRRNLDTNSIHHSFNKCVTVHMTSNLDVEDNVCARIVGHIFYEEHGDGGEHRASATTSASAR